MKTTGVVLNQIKYNDHSFIVKILTESNGIVSFMVRISKSAKRKQHQILQSGNIIYLDLLIKQNSSLQRIKDYSIAIPYTSIPYDIIKSTQVLFLCEIVLKSIQEIDVNQFYFVKNAFLALDESKNAIFTSNFHLLFLAHFTTFLGIEPHNSFQQNQVFDINSSLFVSERQPIFQEVQIAQLLALILGTKFDGNFSQIIDSLTRKQLLKKLLKYYQYHIQGMGTIKSLEVLEAIAN